jgi:hypothetical protein
VRRQRERPVEGAVAHLAEGTAVLVLGPLVAAFPANDQAAAVDLDGHVVGEVDIGQLEADDSVVAAWLMRKRNVSGYAD